MEARLGGLAVEAEAQLVNDVHEDVNEPVDRHEGREGDREENEAPERGDIDPPRLRRCEQQEGSEGRLLLEDRVTPMANSVLGSVSDDGIPNEKGGSFLHIDR